MSTKFYSVEEAQGYVKALIGLGPEATFEEIETVPVGTFGSDILLADPETSQALKDGITATMAAQRTFRLIENGQEKVFIYEGKEFRYRFTIGPFRDGLDCWVLNAETGIAQRL